MATETIENERGGIMFIVNQDRNTIVNTKYISKIEKTNFSIEAYIGGDNSKCIVLASFNNSYGSVCAFLDILHAIEEDYSILGMKDKNYGQKVQEIKNDLKNDQVID